MYENEYRLYEDALMVQGACNITAVIRSLGQAMSFLRQERNLDEKAMRRHPVVRAFIYKVSDMMDIISCESAYLHQSLEECEKWLRSHGYKVPNY